MSSGSAQSEAGLARLMPYLAGWRINCLVEAAISSGTLERLRERPSTPDALATELGWDFRGMRLLLQALESIGLALHEEGTYRLSPLGATLLGGEPPPSAFLHLGLYGPSDFLAPLWNDLASSLGQGGRGTFAAPETDEARLDYLATLWQKSHRLGLARFVGESLPLGERRRVLDIGGSSGVHAFELVQRNPCIEATVFDLPEMIRLAERFNEGRPGGDRVHFSGGDFFRDPLPADHDVALLVNIVHDWGAVRNATIVEKAAAALEPGGLLAVYDVLLPPGEAPPLYHSLFGIDMFLVAEGEAYSESDVAQWMRAAGLGDVAVVRDEASMHTLVHATKPGSR